MDLGAVGSKDEKIPDRNNVRHRLRNHPSEVPQPTGEKENITLLYEVAANGGASLDPDKALCPVWQQLSGLIKIPDLDHPEPAMRGFFNSASELEALLDGGDLGDSGHWRGLP